MSQAQSQFVRRVVSQIHVFGYICLGVATLLWTITNWHCSDPVRLLSFAVKVASYPTRVLQTGQVQSYALVFALGLLAFLGYFLTR